MRCVCRISVFIVALLACAAASAQTGPIGGFCVNGATSSLTSGLASSNKLQGVISACTVTVYLTGTTQPATIYKDGINTPLGNPFVANADGSWLFWVSTTNLYDVQLSGGVPPNSYAVPRTIVRLEPTFLTGTVPVGGTLTQAVVNTACPGTTTGVIVLPTGTVNQTTQINVPSNCHIYGGGQSTLSISNVSGVTYGLYFGGVTNSELSGFKLACATSPATCSVAVQVQESTHIKLRNMTISGGGWNLVPHNPHGQISLQNVDDVLIDTVRLVNSGTWTLSQHTYEIVNSYFGIVGRRVHIHNLTDENTGSVISLSLFDCQLCTVDGGTTIDEGNVFDDPSLEVDGYGIMFYATNSAYPISSCTGTGTLTCTVPLVNGTTQLPVAQSFKVQLNGAVGGAGLNSTVTNYDATLLSPTTFSVSNASLDSVGAAFSYTGTGNVISGNGNVAITMPKQPAVPTLVTGADITVFTWVIGVSGTCATGCTLSLSQAPTGSNATETLTFQATAYYPSTDNLVNDVHVHNAGGTCIYLQGADYTTIENYELDGCSIQQRAVGHPEGGVSLNSGYYIHPIAYGDVVGSGTIYNSFTHGIDIANTVNASIGGAIAMRNIGGYGIRDFGGTFGNMNYTIGGAIEIDGSTFCFRVDTGAPHSGTVGGITCNDFSVEGFHITSPAALNLTGPNVVNAPSYLPCLNISTPTVVGDMTCNGGFAEFQGGSDNSYVSGLKIFNTSPNRGSLFLTTASNLVFDGLRVDNALNAVSITGGVAGQVSNLTLIDPILTNISSSGIGDAPPAFGLTGGVSNGTNTVTLAATNVGVAAGMGISDYEGSNLIPVGAVITGGPYNCVAGCSVTFAGSPSTGTNAADKVEIQFTMSTGVHILNPFISGTGHQGILSYSLQNSDINGGTITGFDGGLIDLRGQTNGLTITGVRLNLTTPTSVGINLPNMGLGPPLQPVGNPLNVNAEFNVIQGSGTYTIFDPGIGTGNIFGPNYINSTASNGVGVTNTHTTIRANYTFALTPAAATISTCTEQAFTPSSRFYAQPGQSVAVTPPSNMGTHVWISYARASALNTIAISFCADATGGTPPAGNWIMTVN